MAENKNNKQIVYVDMDFTLCDFGTAYRDSKIVRPEIEFPQSRQGFFINLSPIADAVKTFKWLSSQPKLDVYILTAPSIRNPNSYIEKRLWVEKWLGLETVRNLIISPHKGLNRGDFLIDDQIKGKGQESFEGQIIQFGSQDFPDWNSIQKHFESLLQISA